MDETVGHLPVVELNDTDVRRVLNGIKVEVDSDHKNQAHVRLRDASGELIALGVYDSEMKMVHPRVVLTR
jgi:tRNA U55 pseudouridine synthase TruB